MLSTDGFKISKRMAQVPLGPAGKHSFVYWSDFQRKWEWSYANAKVVELIGSQSMPAENLYDVKAVLGELRTDEKSFANAFRGLFADLATLLTTVPAAANSETDLYETLLDLRELDGRVRFPCRILDVGPGAGRHLAATCLSPSRPTGVYVGLESIGMCYTLQNALASLLGVRDRRLRFVDAVDYQFARTDIPPLAKAQPGSIYHVPLWMPELLPDRYFDLIVCSYVLDELSADDFHRVAGLIGRCLADDGIVYCRGSQQRALLRDMYLYGYGTFHGQDITRTLLAQGLRTVDCRLVASQLTRTFARASSAKHPAAAGPYATFAEDIPLLETLQRDYVRENLDQIRRAKLRVAVWGDPGYELYGRHVHPCLDGMHVLAMTHRMAGGGGPTPFGPREISPAELSKLGADVIMIASMRDKSILRQLRELAAPGEFARARSFNYPVTFAYQK